MKHLIVIILTCMLPILPAVGCDQDQAEPASKETPTVPISEKNIPTEPSPPITVDLSFPDGAPSLNQEAKLICIFKTLRDLKNVTVEIRLPEGFELINGELSWMGDISAGDELKIIDTTIRAVEIGNWAIEIRQSMNPEKQSNLSFYPDWQDGIYVSVSEDSAEWGIRPPWFKEPNSLKENDTKDLPEPPAAPPPSASK